MANTDSDMPGLYDNSEYYIEDRTTRRTFHQHKAAGFWSGDTYVAAIGDSLNVPPPLRGRATLTQPGVNPGHSVSVAIPAAAPAQSAPLCPAANTPNRGWGAPAWGLPSGPFAHKHAQDGDRHWESPQHHDNVLRQQAMQSRPRFRDEAHWSGSLQQSRSPHWETTSSDYASRMRDNHRRAPTPGSAIGHRYGSHDAPRIVPSPELRLAPRGSDAHPQAPDTVRHNDPEYVGSDDGVASDFDYVKREESRLAVIHAPRGPSVMYKMEGVLYWCPSGTLSATGAYEATMSGTTVKPLPLHKTNNQL
ncbi:hypothetical protein C8J57DRAFT_1546272 [Mycena rebaudengoi]|nr:hypothetical protein C8J57DRAFT_1546272 [Mycena rebaudengoi]